MTRITHIFVLVILVCLAHSMSSPVPVKYGNSEIEQEMLRQIFERQLNGEGKSCEELSCFT